MTKKQSKPSKRAIAKQNAEALQRKQLEKLNGAYERATGQRCQS